MELNINQELKSLIPPLTTEEYQGLEKNIINEGCRDAIVLWDNTIIDGHNRYEICQRHGVEFKTIEYSFSSLEDVKDWMDANQLNRRNLTPDQRKIIIGRRYNREKKAVAGRTDREFGGAKNATPKTSERLAGENKIAPRTVMNYAKEAEQYEQIKEQKPEVADKIWSGEITMRDYKKEEKKAKLQEAKKVYTYKPINNDKKPEITLMDCHEYLGQFADNSIDLLITDPPYMTDVEDVYEFAKWINLALQKVKPSGRAYVCIGAYPKELNAYFTILLSQDKFILDNPLIWTYRNTLGVTPKMKYNLNYQAILHLYSKDSKELDTSITNEMFSVQDINAPDGRQGNRLHTWQKPDELARRLIKHGSVEGDIIVDCFACTGTFLIEAVRQGRNAYGCDNDSDNLNIAKQRGCIIHGM